MSNSVGSKYEREYINLMDDNGFAAIRVPASGSSTDRELPDCHVGRDGRTIATENKYIGQGKDRIYVQEEKAEGLEWFAEMFGSEAYIAARFGGDTSWYLAPVQEAYRTDSGNCRVKRGTRDQWPTLEEIVSKRP